MPSRNYPQNRINIQITIPNISWHRLERETIYLFATRSSLPIVLWRRSRIARTAVPGEWEHGSIAKHTPPACQPTSPWQHASSFTDSQTIELGDCRAYVHLERRRRRSSAQNGKQTFAMHFVCQHATWHVRFCVLRGGRVRLCQYTVALVCVCVFASV